MKPGDKVRLRGFAKDGEGQIVRKAYPEAQGVWIVRLNNNQEFLSQEHHLELLDESS